MIPIPHSSSASSIPHLFALTFLLLLSTTIHVPAASTTGNKEDEEEIGSIQSVLSAKMREIIANPTKVEEKATGEWIAEMKAIVSKILRADANLEIGAKALKHLIPEHKMDKDGTINWEEAGGMVLNVSGVAALKNEVEANLLLVRTSLTEIEALAKDSAKAMLKRHPALAAYPAFRREVEKWEDGWGANLSRQFAAVHMWEKTWRDQVVNSLEYAAKEEKKVHFSMDIDLTPLNKRRRQRDARTEL